MTPAIQYLARQCLKWGGALVLLTDEQFCELGIVDMRGQRTLGPDGLHAIDLLARTVYAVAERADAGAIIHEMGHLFLAEGHPSTTYEPDWLGWEIALAKRAGCYRIWSKQNAAYELGDGTAWEELTATGKARVALERMDRAMALGIVSQDGEPLCTRPVQ